MIAGTGFRVDIARLAYLPEELRARIATFSGYPVLTRAGESTVPGLYFVGAPAAFGFGPVDAVHRRHAQCGRAARQVNRPTCEWEQRRLDGTWVE